MIKPIDSNEYETPHVFFNRLNDEFRFGLDAFATVENARVKPFISKYNDAFVYDWCAPMAVGVGRAVFANPPYSSNILGRAVERMAEQNDSCVLVFRPWVRGPQFSSMES